MRETKYRRTGREIQQIVKSPVFISYIYILLQKGSGEATDFINMIEGINTAPSVKHPVV